MRKAIVMFICVFLVSCSKHFPATIIIKNTILRGSASDATLGSDVMFDVKNVNGLFCEGKLSVLMTSNGNNTGTIDCNNKKKGHFTVNRRKASWVGEGKLDDGSKFVISIGR